MPAAIYTPKELGNGRTNYLRASRLWSDRKEAVLSVEAHVPGAVIVEGETSSLEMEIPLPALSELAGFEVKSPLSCGCAAIESCPHRSILSCSCPNTNLCDHGKVLAPLPAPPWA